MSLAQGQILKDKVFLVLYLLCKVHDIMVKCTAAIVFFLKRIDNKRNLIVGLLCVWVRDEDEGAGGCQH